jgi:fucose permease
MSKPMSNMNKPLSKTSTTLLGAGLSIFGSVLIFFTAIQLGDFVPMFLNMLGAGLFGIGTMVLTVAKAMKEPDGEEPKESQTKP